MKDVTGVDRPEGYGDVIEVEIPAERRERSIMTQSDKFNKKTRMKHLFNEIHLSFRNYHVFEEAFASKRAMDADKIPKAKDKPILIIGSGPSFNRLAPLLSKWEGDIMCSTSQASTCIYWGKDPTYILALDPDSHWAEMPVDSWEGRESMLLTHPAVSNDLITNWPNRIGLFRKCEPQTPFYGNAQKIGYSIIRRYYDERSRLVQMNVTPYIPTEIVMLGCALNAQIFLAELIGYTTMYLCGADFGYPGNISRFNRWTYEIANGRWIEDKGLPIDTKHPNLIMSENGIFTEFIMLFYRKNFASAWRLQKQNMISCSTGVIADVPYVDIEDVVAQQGELGGKVKGITRPQAILRAEGYMAQHHTFVIQFQKGIQFTEFENGAVQIKDYMEKMEQAGVKDLAYNETLKGVKKLARAGYLTDEEKKVVMSWEYRPKSVEAEKGAADNMRMPEIRQQGIKVEPVAPPKEYEPEPVPSPRIDKKELENGKYEREKLDDVEVAIGEKAEEGARKIYVSLDPEEQGEKVTKEGTPMSADSAIMSAETSIKAEKNNCPQ